MSKSDVDYVDPDYLDFFVKFLKTHQTHIITDPHDKTGAIQFCQEFVSSFQGKFQLNMGGKVILYHILLMKGVKLESKSKSLTGLFTTMYMLLYLNG